MKMLDHTNVTTLLHYFYTEGEKAEETYLNLVMDFVPQTVYSMSRQYAKAKKAFPTLFMKLYTYQLCRSLAYIHSLGVCHETSSRRICRARDAHAQAVRRLGEDPRQGRAERLVHLLALCERPSSSLARPTTRAASTSGRPAACWPSCSSACRYSRVSRASTSSSRSSRCSGRRPRRDPADESELLGYKFPQVRQRLQTLTLLHHHHSPLTTHTHTHTHPLTPLTTHHSPLTTHHPTAGQAAPVVEGLPTAHAERRDRPRRQIPKVRPCFAKPFSPSNTLLLLHATPHSTHSTHLPTLPYPLPSTGTRPSSASSR